MRVLARWPMLASLYDVRGRERKATPACDKACLTPAPSYGESGPQARYGVVARNHDSRRGEWPQSGFLIDVQKGPDGDGVVDIAVQSAQ
jgi:hypothetical protein